MSDKTSNTIKAITGSLFIGCGVLLILSGMDSQPISLAKVLFGIVGFIAGLYFVIFADMQWDHGNRHTDLPYGFPFRYVRDDENPNHCPCVICGRLSRLIFSEHTKPVRKGYDCPNCGILWFIPDKSGKIEQTISRSMP
jgi:hypothetical protein